MPTGRCPCGAVSFAAEESQTWRAHRRSESRHRAASPPLALQRRVREAPRAGWVDIADNLPKNPAAG